MPRKAPVIVDMTGKEAPIPEPLEPTADPEPAPPPKLRGFCRWNFDTKTACQNRSVVGSEWCAEHKCADCNEHAHVVSGRCVKCYAKAYRAS